MDEENQNKITGCVSAVIMIVFAVVSALNLWLTWRICHAVEAILAK